MRGKVAASFHVEAGRHEFLVPSSSLHTGITILEARTTGGRAFTAAVSRL
jgi:hypothetical protein